MITDSASTMEVNTPNITTMDIETTDKMSTHMEVNTPNITTMDIVTTDKMSTHQMTSNTDHITTEMEEMEKMTSDWPTTIETTTDEITIMNLTTQAPTLTTYSA